MATISQEELPKSPALPTQEQVPQPPAALQLPGAALPNQPQIGLYLSLVFDIDANYANTLIQTVNQNLLANPSLKTLYILMSSGGGSVASALAIYEYLLSLKIDVVTHNVGSVDSSAVLVYLAGKKRYAVKGSSFLLHPIRNVSTLQNPSTGEAEDIIETIHRHTAQYAELVAKNTKLSAGRVSQYMTETKSLSAPEALKENLVHQIRALPNPLTILR